MGNFGGRFYLRDSWDSWYKCVRVALVGHIFLLTKIPEVFINHSYLFFKKLIVSPISFLSSS